MSIFKILPVSALLIAASPSPSWAESSSPPMAQASVMTVNALHADWTGLLTSYVATDETGLNLVDYKAWSDSANDLKRLSQYIEGLASQQISALPKDDQFAAWANLYNALTVQLIIENYPVKSIREIRSGLFTSGPWKRKVITVEGKTLSLDDIEHGILRTEFSDPRVHYSVNCASVGCPNLRKDAFTGDTLDMALDEAARDYINSSRGAHVTPKGKLITSSIYDWFQVDFGGSEQDVIDHLKRYAEPELAERLSTLADIDRFEYDWSLNDTSRKGRK